MTTTDRIIERGHCPLDGLPLASHPKCQRCGLLIGEKHYATKALRRGEKMLCEDCAARHGAEALQDGSGAAKGSEQ